MVDKIRRAMHEYKHGTLRSGSKRGPKVTSRQQAIAIGLSEQAKADAGGYAEGGVVGALSRGIESVARTFGTEGGRALASADKALSTPARPRPATITGRVDAMERGMAGGGLVQHRGTSGRYANGGVVVHDRRDTGSKGLSAAARSRFARNSRGH